MTGSTQVTVRETAAGEYDVTLPRQGGAPERHRVLLQDWLVGKLVAHEFRTAADAERVVREAVDAAEHSRQGLPEVLDVGRRIREDHDFLDELLGRLVRSRPSAT
ncbi:MAG TPA: hypothetical protein VIL00_15210 [Pseudonocardiaceae bacterium]